MSIVANQRQSNIGRNITRCNLRTIKTMNQANRLGSYTSYIYFSFTAIQISLR
jgi:hypothetical protein